MPTAIWRSLLDNCLCLRLRCSYTDLNTHRVYVASHYLFSFPFKAHTMALHTHPQATHTNTHSHTHTAIYLIWYRREKKGARTHLDHERDEQHNISWESARMVKEVYEKEMVGDVWWSTLGHRWWRLRRRRATLFNAFAISPSYIYIYIFILHNTTHRICVRVNNKDIPSPASSTWFCTIKNLSLCVCVCLHYNYTRKRNIY